MAKTVAKKLNKVTKPKDSLVSTAAEPSKKPDAKAKLAVAEKPSSKAAGKRKSIEENFGVERVKRIKATTEEPEQSVSTEKRAAVSNSKAEVKAKEKGKKRVEAIQEQPEELKTVASSKSKATKSKKVAASEPKVKSPSPPPEESDTEEHEAEADVAEEEEEEEEEDVQLFDFSTDDDNDSSDDELNVDPDPVEVGKLPTIAKDDAIVKKKLEKAKRKPTEDRGVIYLGRVPHGFYEEQMKSYFMQFGDVTRLRLSRNKRTGRSKHYAFIEFASSSVAQIVAETMDNYLLMGHILTCKVIPKDKVHSELWIGANRKWRAVPRDRVARVQHNKLRTEEEQEKVEKRLLKRQVQKKRKLEEAGIKYDFDAVAYKKRSKSIS
ncbi:uncharacterized protein PHACADRAFT_140250 [Phanerochaete carnosa HHB-10118-sp]|uniref:RRM domain-containing protein n=1 Tax=Phanerochaete carnosa (strain HHB-10118-sp) TaxID=650164 RepID=K5WGF9_PHACS|nr:uncharacterized protein PHACADRAFT_140250 [Phanerochaete carnosa HHB-10118-sp]EKM58385.1 hypothetical protein PHACADRAFT_140250 [Phanerochaete carnosa HHB-10118-sp]